MSSLIKLGTHSIGTLYTALTLAFGNCAFVMIRFVFRAFHAFYLCTTFACVPFLLHQPFSVAFEVRSIDRLLGNGQKGPKAVVVVVEHCRECFFARSSHHPKLLSEAFWPPHPPTIKGPTSVIAAAGGWERELSNLIPWLFWPPLSSLAPMKNTPRLRAHIRWNSPQSVSSKF